MTFTLVSCARPARYVLIQDNVAEVRYKGYSQRYICLSDDDAKKYEKMLALRTTSDVDKFGQERPAARTPVEDILYHLISADYKTADDLLKKHQAVVPAYLRLMFKADLSAELGLVSGQSQQLINLYQEALDAQPCKLSGDLIKFRIRQWRFGL